MNGSVFKVCPSCGRTYDLAGWRALEFVGVWVFDADELDVRETRNCFCLSSILAPTATTPIDLVSTIVELQRALSEARERSRVAELRIFMLEQRL